MLPGGWRPVGFFVDIRDPLRIGSSSYNRSPVGIGSSARSPVQVSSGLNVYAQVLGDSGSASCISVLENIGSAACIPALDSSGSAACIPMVAFGRFLFKFCFLIVSCVFCIQLNNFIISVNRICVKC